MGEGEKDKNSHLNSVGGSSSHVFPGWNLRCNSGTVACIPSIYLSSVPLHRAVLEIFKQLYWSVVDLQCCVGFSCTAK